MRYYLKRYMNIILGGGGVKGVAHIGALEAASKFGYQWVCVGGVSAGAVVGALAAAGYSAPEMLELIRYFNFKKVTENEEMFHTLSTENALRQKLFETFGHRADLDNRFNRNPKSYIEEYAARAMVNSKTYEKLVDDEMLRYDYRGGILQNLLNIVKDGGIYDGDYLENWLRGKLAYNGVRTFRDLKDPNFGYRLKVLATDATLGKVLTLPQDISRYGYDPDRLEVAKAVRISMSVPYFFKPVKLDYIENGVKKVSNLVDGGLLSRFPSSLYKRYQGIANIGFQLTEKNENRMDISYPINTIKGLISMLWNSKDPIDTKGLDGLVEIDSSTVSFLDFNLSPEDISKLYVSGYRSSSRFFNSFVQHN